MNDSRPSPTKTACQLVLVDAVSPVLLTSVVVWACCSRSEADQHGQSQGRGGKERMGRKAQQRRSEGCPQPPPQTMGGGMRGARP